MAYWFFTCRFHRLSTYNICNSQRYFVSVNLRVSDVCPACYLPPVPSTSAISAVNYSPAVKYFRFLRFFASKNARNIPCRRVFVFVQSSPLKFLFLTPHSLPGHRQFLYLSSTPHSEEFNMRRVSSVIYSTSPTKIGMSCECIRRLFRCYRQELSALSGWPGIQCAKKIFAVRDASTAF
jgi:hypothetical protein